jgi:Zn-dependent oligopeptidase
MNYEQKYFKYKKKYEDLKKQIGGNYDCKKNLYNVQKLNDICTDDNKGKFKTKEECIFSNECLEKWKIDKDRWNVILSDSKNKHSLNLPRYDNLDENKILEIGNKIKEKIIKIRDHILSINDDDLCYSNLFEYPLFIESQYELENYCILNMYILHPKENIRTTCAEIKQQVENFDILEKMNKDVYKKIDYYYKNNYENEKNNLSNEQKKYIEKVMIEYLNNGLKLTEIKYEEMININEQISKNENNYLINLSNVDTKIIFDESDLLGLDEEWKKLRFDKDNKNYIITVKSNDYFPIMENCSIRKTRQIMEELWLSRCYDENLPILIDTITLRKRKAELLGYKSYSDLKLKKNIAQNTETVMKFLNNLLEKIKPLADHEIKIFKELAKEDGILDFKSYDYYYYDRIYKEKEAKIELIKLSKFFTIESVTEGIFNIYQNFLDLKFINITNENKIHIYDDDVELYSVYNKSDINLEKVIGYFYLDLYPREGKYSSIAVMTFLAKSKYKLPISTMICNFDKGNNIIFDNVVDFFHEFGHLMHNICSTNEIPFLAGLNVEKDFIETPSQMFEEWCFCLETLKELAVVEYKKDITPELVNKINYQRKLGASFFYLRQISFSLWDMYIHSQNIPKTGEETWIFYNKLCMGLFGYKINDGINYKINMLANWNAMMIDYDSSYYSYQWSKVYAVDLFSKITCTNIENNKIGNQFRNKILSKGSTKNGIELLKDFLGRDPDFNTFSNWLKYK